MTTRCIFLRQKDRHRDTVSPLRSFVSWWGSMKTSYDGIQHSTMTRDLRGCHFCLTYLNAAKNIPFDNCDKNDIHSCQTAIRSMISKVAPNGEYRAHLIAELEQAYAINILSKGCFDWFKEDERAAFWLWALICQSDDISLGIHQPENTNNGYQNLYHWLNLCIRYCKGMILWR